jgi:molybdopterin-guanine dinucleotide biosynthesis protein A
MIVGVILAGGLSTRMGGGDKPLLALGGRPILAHVIERLGPQVDRLALSANGDPARFAGFGLPVVADSVPGYAGPLAGVLAGMDWAAGLGAAAIVTAAGDTPFFPDDLVAALRGAALAEGRPLAIAVTPGPRLHPTFGLWPVGMREDLRSALGGGVRRVLDWTEARGSAHALFGRSEAFFNVNAPADLARARRMCGRRGEARGKV